MYLLTDHVLMGNIRKMVCVFHVLTQTAKNVIVMGNARHAKTAMNSALIINAEVYVEMEE